MEATVDNGGSPHTSILNAMPNGAMAVRLFVLSNIVENRQNRAQR